MNASTILSKGIDQLFNKNSLLLFYHHYYRTKVFETIMEIWDIVYVFGFLLTFRFFKELKISDRKTISANINNNIEKEVSSCHKLTDASSAAGRRHLAGCGKQNHAWTCWPRGARRSRVPCAWRPAPLGWLASPLPVLAPCPLWNKKIHFKYIKKY